MTRCADPTCWRLPHTRDDHLTVPKRVQRYLIESGAWTVMRPATRGAPQLDLAGLLGPVSEGEAAALRGSPDARPFQRGRS